MIIAIPTAAGKLAMHFGHCEVFSFVEVDEKSGKIISSQDKPPPAHQPGVLPRWLGEEKADVVIAGGMGQRAQALFQQQGIKLIIGAPSDTPENVVSAYLAGTLQTGDNICDH